MHRHFQKIITAFFLFSVVTLFILVPLFQRVAETARGDVHRTHDGLLETHYALELLTQGRNIYHEDVPKNIFPPPHDHIQVHVSKHGKVKMENPALYHYVYPPLYFIQFAPLYELLQKLGTGFDLRWGLLLYLLGSIALLWRMPVEIETKIIGLFLLFINPWFLKFFLEGRNDIVVFFWLLLTFQLLQNQRWGLSIFSLGIACLMKQTAWLFVPFVYLYLYHAWERTSDPGYWKDYAKRALRLSIPVMVLAALILIPFIFSDFQGLYEDLFAYPSGKSATSYPIHGYSLLALLIRMDFPISPFSFHQTGLLQLPAYLLVLLWAHISLKKHCTIAVLLFRAAFAISLFWFLSRFYHDNYLVFTASIFVLSWLFKKQASYAKHI
ncbi:MAG: hypothetical protein Q7T03_06300 [Deltaproteobacteria bacterium]|nr:hypothetical protein [Deltaproteobacteria bacterium]